MPSDARPRRPGQRASRRSPHRGWLWLPAVRLPRDRWSFACGGGLSRAAVVYRVWRWSFACGGGLSRVAVVYRVWRWSFARGGDLSRVAAIYRVWRRSLALGGDPSALDGGQGADGSGQGG